MIRASLPVSDPALEAAAQFDGTRLSGYGAVAASALEERVTGFAYRGAKRVLLDNDKFSDYLSAEEASDQYGIAGHLEFDRSVSAYHAAARNRIKQRELQRSDIIARSGIGTGEALTVALAASLLDPLGDALAMVPYAGVAKYANTARAAGKATTFAARARRGAIEGTGAGVLIEGTLFPLAQYEGRDYGAGDAMFNIALAAGIGSGGRLVGDALKARGGAGGTDIDPTIKLLPENDPIIGPSSPEARQAAFEQAVLAVSEGRTVQAGELLSPQGKLGSPLLDEAAAAGIVDVIDFPTSRAETRDGSLAKYTDMDFDGKGPSDLDTAPQDYVDASAPFEWGPMGETAQLDLFGTPEAPPPKTDNETGVDPVLTQAVADLEAEIAGLVENGRLAEAEVAELKRADAITAEKTKKTTDLLEAAAFCLSAEGLL